VRVSVETHKGSWKLMGTHREERYGTL